MDDLMKIPGVGKNIAKHLREIGICCAADLVGKYSEELYLKDCFRKTGASFMYSVVRYIMRNTGNMTRKS